MYTNLTTTAMFRQPQGTPVLISMMSALIILLSLQSNAQTCATSQRLVKTDFFDFGPVGNGAVNITSVVNQFGWTGSGSGTIAANTNTTRFELNGVLMSMSQPVTDANLNGNGATVSISIAASDFNPRNNSNGAQFRISYGGTVYCTITNPSTPDTDPEAATVVYTNGATGPGGITSSSFPVTAGGITTFNTVVILLPAGIPNNGDLLLTFDASSGNDDFVVESVSFLACPNTGLPISFGSINANIEDDVLLINWSSLTETNNSHFEIEASADGKRFTKIGEVKSKALDGNADAELYYEFTKALPGISFAGIGVLLLGGIGFIYRRRTLFTILVLAGVVISIAGCKKENRSVTEGDGKLFIRIAQVDKDGKKTYSKTVNAIIK